MYVFMYVWIFHQILKGCDNLLKENLFKKII